MKMGKYYIMPIWGKDISYSLGMYILLYVLVGIENKEGAVAILAAIGSNLFWQCLV